MRLSIIIVNYNVKYFLEQCLHSVQQATAHLRAEVFVVDNHSADNSVAYLQAIFPWVKVIANTENAGFAKANNQAIPICRGDYILFLNPDTILPEDCLEKCIRFLDSHADAGALGIRMLDGCGNFLPESKRSFPSPLTSLYKLAGLSRLFPKSKIFSRYALGHLSQYETNEVDVLAGAFMMVRRPLAQALQGFDEAFFMYGEDIDLSYRIQKAGYKNYYFSESSIIHFKGESTKKGSLNYVRMFYEAMSIFVRKHYGGKKAGIYNVFIQMAIAIRATLSAISNFIFKIGLPLLDALVIVACFELWHTIWVSYLRAGENFVNPFINFASPAFTLVFMGAAVIAGIYDNKYKPLKTFYAAFFAIIVMLAVYSLLPEQYRFSRGVILLGGISASACITFMRWLLVKWKWVDDVDDNKQLSTLIVGSAGEYEAVLDILNNAGARNSVIGRVAPHANQSDALCTINEMPTIIRDLHIKEIVFCQGSFSYTNIINAIERLPLQTALRFHAAGSLSIVGSDSRNTSGNYVAEDGHYEITNPYQKRMKRMVDIAIAFFIIVTFPFHLLLSGATSIANAFAVLGGKKTWVGYAANNNSLPYLHQGVLSATGLPLHKSPELTKSSADQVDFWYAKNYEWSKDLKIILRYYRRLGGRG